uniref:Non-haem dioxygenase N-terminal domain-containing protein n=1 Tax=Aegilops tauschii TaxID=37682 RepID=R7VYT4_AEGTA
MDRIGDEVVLTRAEITDAAAATFADSTVIPDRYARPDEVRDGVVVGDDESYELPLVDMARLLDSESSEAETAKLGSACRDWGFFQLTNHGVDESVVQDMKDSTMQFFRLPLDKKKAVATQAGGLEGFGHHFAGASCDKLDWAESLILLTQQKEQRSMEFWPADPATLRPSLDKYSLEMSRLTSRLMAFMASDLGDACVAGTVRPLPGLGEARYRAIEYVEYLKGNYRGLAEGTRFVDSLEISVA